MATMNTKWNLAEEAEIQRSYQKVSSILAEWSYPIIVASILSAGAMFVSVSWKNDGVPEHLMDKPQGTQKAIDIGFRDTLAQAEPGLMKVDKLLNPDPTASIDWMGNQDRCFSTPHPGRASCGLK